VRRTLGPLSGLAARHRGLAWILLLILTAGLLLSPIRLVGQYQPIQAPYLFENLPLFCTLFFIWVLLLATLVVTKPDSGRRPNWENLGLVCIFGLVYLGFWIVVTPNGSYADGAFNMGHVNWLLEEGSIPIGHQNLVYFDFPGLHLFASSLAQLGGVSVLQSRMLALVANVLLFSGCLYLVAVQILGSNRLAMLAASLVMVGSILIADDITVFYPRALGFTMLVAFMLLLTKFLYPRDRGAIATQSIEGVGTGATDKLLLIVLFTAMVVSYFATSFLAPLLLLGLLVVARLTRTPANWADAQTVVILLVMVTAWGLYWSWHFFDNMADFVPAAWEDFSSGRFLATALTLGTANIGSRLPLWANVVRGFWFGFLVTSTVLGLYAFVRSRKLTSAEVLVAGGLLGVIGLTIAGLVGTHGGQQFSRFLMYAPLFAVPALLLFLSQRGRVRQVSSTALATVVVLLALPTFLCAVNTVGTDAVRAYEWAAGDFAAGRLVSRGETTVIHSLTFASRAWVYTRAPDATLRNPREKDYYIRSEEEVWEEAEELATLFKEGWVLRGMQKLFVFSDKDPIHYQHVLGVPTDDPRWESLLATLEKANRMFDNGGMRVYQETRWILAENAQTVEASD